MSIQYFGHFKLKGKEKDIEKAMNLLNEEAGTAHYDTKKFPSVWLQWIITQEKDTYILNWNGSEKFYEATEWLNWIIINILNKHNIKIKGKVIQIDSYSPDNTGVIKCKKNKTIFCSLTDLKCK